MSRKCSLKLESKGRYIYNNFLQLPDVIQIVNLDIRAIPLF